MTLSEQKARAIAEAQRIRDPKDSRRLEEIELVMEDKRERLRLLRLVQTCMEEERADAAARLADKQGSQQVTQLSFSLSLCLSVSLSHTHTHTHTHTERASAPRGCRVIAEAP